MRVSVRVKTGSSQQKIEWIDSRSAQVWVREKPIEGRANAAVRALLADYFDVGISKVNLIKGETSKTKLWEIAK